MDTVVFSTRHSNIFLCKVLQKTRFGLDCLEATEFVHEVILVVSARTKSSITVLLTFVTKKTIHVDLDGKK